MDTTERSAYVGLLAAKQIPKAFGIKNYFRMVSQCWPLTALKVPKAFKFKDHYETLRQMAACGHTSVEGISGYTSLWND